MIDGRSVALGAGAVIAGRALIPRALLVKFRRDLRRLNDGDYRPLLANYADDAVLRFNTGAHRWAGEHRGKPAIERFLRQFTAAGLQGQLRALWIAGPPWAMTVLVRFDDRAVGPSGEELYANRVAMVLRTRWGKVVEQEDFFEDTGRILALEEKLQALGKAPAAA